MSGVSSVELRVRFFGGRDSSLDFQKVGVQGIDVMPFWEHQEFSQGISTFFNIEMQGSGSADNLQVR